MNGDHEKCTKKFHPSDVDTAFTADMEASLNEIVEWGGSMAATGDCGLGKSFAAMRAVIAVAAARGLPWMWVENGPVPSILRVTRNMHRQLGLPPLRRGDDVTEQVIDAIACKHLIYVIDEVQWLTEPGLAQFRMIHEAPESEFTLVLLGGANADEKLAKCVEVDSRLDGHVHFVPYDPDEMVTVLRKYHTAFEAVPKQTLKDIDRSYAQGNFRRWAKLFGRAMRYAAKTGTPGVLTPKAWALALWAFDVDPHDAGIYE